MESVSNVETSTAQSEEEYNDGEHSTVHTDEVTCSNNTNNEATQMSRCISSEARACLLLESNMISFDSKLHVFTVKGSSGVARVVTLFPKQSCSCPSTGECYHILAVKKSIGMETENKKNRKSLTQLRRNNKKRGDKRSGRKWPRPKDIDVNISLQGIYFMFQNYLMCFLHVILHRWPSYFSV